MSAILDTIAEAKRSLVGQLEQAEAELLGIEQELKEKRIQLDQEILGNKNELIGVRNELAKLKSNGHIVAESVKLSSVSEPGEPSIPPELELDPSKKAGVLQAAFCNTHGITLKKIDDYILVILHNMNKAQEGMSATIEETESLLDGAGYKSNASNFKGILYSAYARLKEAKLVTTDKKPGRTAYYKIANKGIKYVNDQLSQIAKTQTKGTVNVAVVLEALKSPSSLPGILAFVTQAQKLDFQDPIAASQAVHETIKGLVEQGRVKASRSDGQTIYQKA